MKKFMKTCAILALIMIVAGIAMTGMAGAIKGPEVIATAKDYISNSMDKLDSGVRFDIETDMNFDSNAPVLAGDTQQTYSVSEVKNLEVEVGTCELTIGQSEDESIHVNVEGAGNYQGYLSGDTLCLKLIRPTEIAATLSTGEEGINLNLDTSACKMQLLLPADFAFEDVKLSLGAGTVDATTPFRAESLELELAAGEVTVSNLEVNKLNAEVGAGSLTLNGIISQKADLECGMGELSLKITGGKADFNYQVEVAAGEVTIGNESFGGIAGERKIDNNASKDINVECAMGSVEITFTE